MLGEPVSTVSVMSSEETPNAIETHARGRRLTRRIPITAVEQFPFIEETVHHHSTLAIPKSIILSRLWLPVPLSASAPRPEVCVLGAVEDLGINVIPTLEASGSLPLPAVLTAPIRLDVVQQVHSTHTLDQGSRDGILMIRGREHRQK